MNFVELLQSAPKAEIELLTLYDPMLTKVSIVNSAFDEDLYQELRMTLLGRIRTLTM